MRPRPGPACAFILTVICFVFCVGTARASDLRIGFSVDAATLDPAAYTYRDNETLLRLMYDGLTTHGPGMKVVGELAQSWRQTDPLTYEFTLRKGVKFHDGSELTADDVVFTLQRLMTPSAVNGKTSPRRDLLGPLTAVEKADRYTVRLKLAKPWPVLPGMLAFQEITNKVFVEKTGAGLATQEDGTGPYRLLDWHRGEQMVLQRFPDYYGGPTDVPHAGTACVDHLIVKTIPENSARVAALLAGDVEIVNELPVDAIPEVEASSVAKVMSVNGTRTFFVSLNNAKPPFNDVRVRQAANYALDKKLIIDKILRGRATPLAGVLSPDAFGFDPELPLYNYDPAKAKALLAAAGHPNGIDVTLDTDGAGKDMAEAMAALLTQSGIRTKVVVGEASQVRVRWLGGPRGDMWLSSWGNASLDPFDIFHPTLHTGGRGNSSGYSNPRVDALLDAADVDTDLTRRVAEYRDAQEIVNKDAPWIFLWLPQDIYGVSKRLTGFAPSPDGRLNLRDACVH
jgi:peptide/nickel transport system substrate-binding protein